jgi:hypothetical protein
MPNLEHIYLKAPPCQPSNPVLGGSLILLITSRVLRFNFFFGNQTTSGSGFLKFFLETQDSQVFFFFFGANFCNQATKKKEGGLANPTKGFLRS